MGRVRVLVADDSALMRQTLKRIIAASADLDLVGLARDGEDAVAKARELRPDVVSMDINMPKLDGVTALQMILQEKICPVIMVSSLIGYLNIPEGVPALLARLGDESSLAVRDAIFQALIRIDLDPAIEGSIRLLGSEDPQ